MMEVRDGTYSQGDNAFIQLPDHLLIEVFIRVPVSDWVQLSCVRKQWAGLFKGECIWQAALARSYPLASNKLRWPGPIPRGLSRRRFMALYVSEHFLSCSDMVADEIIGHTYLYLKEQLEVSAMAPSSVVLHGTMIDQFVACGKSIDEANERACQIWLAVVDNLVENRTTFVVLKRLALEHNVFLPYPYSRSMDVEWRIFERLFKDFRNYLNLNRFDFIELLASAKSKIYPLPDTWFSKSS